MPRPRHRTAPVHEHDRRCGKRSPHGQCLVSRQIDQRRAGGLGLVPAWRHFDPGSRPETATRSRTYLPARHPRHRARRFLRSSTAIPVTPGPTSTTVPRAIAAENVRQGRLWPDTAVGQVPIGGNSRPRSARQESPRRLVAWDRESRAVARPQRRRIHQVARRACPENAASPSCQGNRFGLTDHSAGTGWDSWRRTLKRFMASPRTLEVILAVVGRGRRRHCGPRWLRPRERLASYPVFFRRAAMAAGQSADSVPVHSRRARTSRAKLPAFPLLRFPRAGLSFLSDNAFRSRASSALGKRSGEERVVLSDHRLRKDPRPHVSPWRRSSWPVHS